jgi:hypothetical protein
MFGNKKKSSAALPAMKSTQSFLKISEIRDDSVIMQDGTLRAILGVSSTNFDLKNEEEQNGMIAGYQRFLNSLEFPVQILMQSRRMNISDYTGKLKGLVDHQANELLRIQTTEYIDFINRLVESANVMNKSFYCIVPDYQSVTPASGGLLSNLFGGGKAKQISRKVENFEKTKLEMDERVGSVVSELSGIGLQVARLNTEQIVELFYDSYNFDSGPTLDAGALGEVNLTQ